LQQVMLLPPEVLNAIIAYSIKIGGPKDLKENIIDSLILLPVIKGGCEPIRKCILDRAQNFEDPNMIQLADNTADDDEDGIKLIKAVFGVSDLQEILLRAPKVQSSGEMEQMELEDCSWSSE